LNSLIKSARSKWKLPAAWDRMRGLLEKGSPRRIFAGKFSRESARVIQTAKNQPRRRHKVRRRKRVLMARKKRVMRAVAAVGRLTLFTGSLILLAANARSHVLSSPRFSLAHIAVEGNAHVTSRDIIARSGIAERENIFKVDLAGSARAIREIPWILDARVWRNLPDEICIEITERRLLALVPSSGLYYVGGGGKVIAGFDPSEGARVPFITAKGFGPLKPGDTLKTEGIAEALEIVRLMAAMGIGENIAISEINIDDPSNIVMVAQRSGANIFLGSGDLKGKLWRLSRVAGAIDRNENLRIEDLEKVDLRFGATVPTKLKGG